MWSMTDVFSSSNSTPHSLPSSRIGSPKQGHKSLLSYGLKLFLKKKKQKTKELINILKENILFTNNNDHKLTNGRACSN